MTFEQRTDLGCLCSMGRYAALGKMNVQNENKILRLPKHFKMLTILIVCSSFIFLLTCGLIIELFVSILVLHPSMVFIVIATSYMSLERSC